MTERQLTTGGLPPVHGEGENGPGWDGNRVTGKWIMAGTHVNAERAGTMGVRLLDPSALVPDGRTAEQYLDDMGYRYDHVRGYWYPGSGYWKRWVEYQYLACLERAPDPGGWEWWTNQQMTHQWTQSEFRERFIGSARAAGELKS